MNQQSRHFMSLLQLL